MWKKMGFSRTHGARVRIIRRWANPRRSLQSEGTSSRWTLNCRCIYIPLSGSSKYVQTYGPATASLNFVSRDLHEEIDSFPSCWLVSEAGPASKTGIFAPNITFRSSFRQSTWSLHHFNCSSQEFHHPCWMRLVCLHIQPVPSSSHVKPTGMW